MRCFHHFEHMFNVVFCLGANGAAVPPRKGVWELAAQDVEKAITEKLGIAVVANSIGPGYSEYSPGRSTDANGGAKSRVDMALKEAERGIISLLKKWPDAQASMSPFLNMPLPKTLRSSAYASALRDPEILHDYLTFFNSDRITRAADSIGTAIYQMYSVKLLPHPCTPSHTHLITENALKTYHEYLVVKRISRASLSLHRLHRNTNVSNAWNRLFSTSGLTTHVRLCAAWASPCNLSPPFTPFKLLSRA